MVLKHPCGSGNKCWWITCAFSSGESLNASLVIFPRRSLGMTGGLMSEKERDRQKDIFYSQGNSRV